MESSMMVKNEMNTWTIIIAHPDSVLSHFAVNL